MDSMMDALEGYVNQLEEKVAERTGETEVLWKDGCQSIVVLVVDFFHCGAGIC